jgi:DNA-binding transcriptional ArsR family regulator
MDTNGILKVATALSDGHRIAIFLALAQRGTMCYKEMAVLTALSQPAVSHHVKILTESGLLKAVKTGRSVRLSLNAQRLQQASAFFLGVLPQTP